MQDREARIDPCISESHCSAIACVKHEKFAIYGKGATMNDENRT